MEGDAALKDDIGLARDPIAAALGVRERGQDGIDGFLRRAIWARCEGALGNVWSALECDERDRRRAGGRRCELRNRAVWKQCQLARGPARLSGASRSGGRKEGEGGREAQ